MEAQTRTRNKYLRAVTVATHVIVSKRDETIRKVNHEAAKQYSEVIKKLYRQYFPYDQQ